MKQLASLVKDATRRPDGPLDVVLFRTAEAFDARLCRALAGDRFWAPAADGVPAWDSGRQAPPENLVVLPGPDVPDHAAPDLVVAPFRAAVTAAARALSAQYQVPLVHLLVDPPDPGLSPGRIRALAARLGHFAVAPDDRTAAAWGVPGCLRAKNWGPAALARAVRGCAGGPYDMRWGFDG